MCGMTMTQPNAAPQGLIGREAEARCLREALRKRQSTLIWGPADAGKSFLLAEVLASLPKNDRRKCICWSGPASRRRLAEHLIGALYAAGDEFVHAKAQRDGFTGAMPSRWIGKQSAARLRGILLSALERTRYWIFLDHLPPLSSALAELMKEIIHRTKTPVCLLSHGYSPAEIGSAWSLYWTDEYRIRLGPLGDDAANRLIELCIRRFGLGSLDRDGFREDVLKFSGNLPGSIVKMCQLAADPRYHYGDQVKVRLLHVDYLLRTHQLPAPAGSRHD